MAVVRDQKPFTTKEEADAYAADFRRTGWAYDASATVQWIEPDRKWVVFTSERDSCD